MTARQKFVLLALGILSAFLILTQLTLGQLLAAGKSDLKKAHQHSGYTTVGVVCTYIALSLWATVNVPTRQRS
jgi:hypothetical protein